jgi:hypothetical protein
MNGGSSGRASTGGTSTFGGSPSGGTPANGGSSAGPSTGGSVAAGGATPTAGTGGTGGSTSTGGCTFNVMSSLSKAISTVGIVEWSVTGLSSVEKAEIIFDLVSPMGDEINVGGVAPVDLKSQNYRTLLLGMKEDRDYKFRVEASGGGGSCKSQDFMLRTGAIPNSVPTIATMTPKATARARGFIVTTGYSMGGFGGGGASMVPSLIIDQDGDVVWWTPAPPGASRARMNWEGTHMWILENNVENSSAEIRQVSMDGLEVKSDFMNLSSAHHDLTVLPGGVVAFLAWSGAGSAPPSSIIERSPDGTLKTVATLGADAYAAPSGYHANAINYYKSDDSYTVSDRFVNLFVKLTRAGQLVWQFGGNCTGAKAPKCATGTWQVNHGHHLLPDGKFLFFNNGSMGAGGGRSPILEFQFTESGTSFTAMQSWSYMASQGSPVLGDVQRLPNGNTLATYSTQGVIHEVNPAGELVQSMTTSSLGYADFRESLYGPPLK